MLLKVKRGRGHGIGGELKALVAKERGARKNVIDVPGRGHNVHGSGSAAGSDGQALGSFGVGGVATRMPISIIDMY